MIKAMLMFKSEKRLAALALAAALISIFALTGGRGGLPCRVEVEPVDIAVRGREASAF